MPEYEAQIREFRSESCSEAQILTLVQKFLKFILAPTKLRNTTIDFFMSARSSVHMEQLVSDLTDFLQI